jgi:hypothetical protein
VSRFFKVAFALSLGFNALFYYRDFCDKPDIDFYGTDRKEAYFIKQREAADSFIIEYRDFGHGPLHRYTAKCQPTLTWEDGIVNPGKPMSDSCIYLPGIVGKTIAAGKMRKEGNTIVYMAWTNDDTVQTADVLSIVRDEEVK